MLPVARKGNAIGKDDCGHNSLGTEPIMARIDVSHCGCPHDGRQVFMDWSRFVKNFGVGA